jgi:cysteine-rich repeat protein
MRRGLVVLAASVALVLAFAGIGRSKKTAPKPCPGGRYIVSGSALVTGDTSGPNEPVVIGPQVSIGNACNPVHAKLKATKKGTTVTATWPSCQGLKGKVKLTAKLDPTCTSLTGKLTAKKSRLNESVVAQLSRCGDGIFDAGNGEQCDGAACPDGAECGADCTCLPLPTSTTTTTPTTTGGPTTTTSTTVPGQLDCSKTPKSCALLGTDVNCCGNGTVDPGEECDDGTGSNSADCSANCLLPRCGNCNVDPGETCDDGNTVDGDHCPASCVIQSCTVDTGTHQGVSLHLSTPAAVTVGGLTLLLDYPEGQVSKPVTTPASGVIDTPNDLLYELKDALLDSTFFAGIPANSAGAMLQVTFDGCQGQALPAAGDYKCTILDAADENGTSIDFSTFGCTVTIP